MSKMQEVLNEVPETDRPLVGLHAMLLWNTMGGRPSDAAHAAVALYNRVGIDRLRHIHHKSHTDALAACGCSACARSLAERHGLVDFEG